MGDSSQYAIKQFTNNNTNVRAAPLASMGSDLRELLTELR